jgi:xylulokinase
MFEFVKTTLTNINFWIGFFSCFVLFSHYIFGNDNALEQLGVNVKRIILIGGAAKNPAVSQIASSLFGREVLVPPAGEYVANGAARQAAWALLDGDAAPIWDLGKIEKVSAVATPAVVERYRTLRDRTEGWK